MLRAVLFLVLIGIFVAAGLYLFESFGKTGGLVKSAEDVVPTIAETNPEPPIFEPFQKEALITITQDGFGPKEIRVKIYTEVIFKNTTEETVKIAADPNNNPTNEMNIGEIPARGQLSFEPYFKREYNYIDQYHPTRTGKITAEL